MFAVRRLGRAASATRGLGGLRPGLHQGETLCFKNGEIPWRARARAHQTTAAMDADGGGWMGRPTTDAHAHEPDIFPARTPADVDKEHFREGKSVAFWNEYRFDGTLQSLKGLVDEIGPTVTSSSDARYWAYHVFRSSFFLGQGAASLFASSGFTPGAGGGNPTPLLGGNGMMSRAGVTAVTRLLAEVVQVYKQDLAHINAGTYVAPYDMHPRHRQFNPLYVAEKTARFLTEAAANLAKARAARATPPSGATKDAMTKVWMGGADYMYPDYYLKTYHWQTDGWLSSASAKVYEVSTETLFLGRQDAMQRTALVPLAHWVHTASAAGSSDEAAAGDTASGEAAVGEAAGTRVIKADGEGARLLEVGCGTGRFLTFVRDNYPKMAVTGLDLSPFYLMEARMNSEYWEKLTSQRRGHGHPETSAESQDAGGGSGGGASHRSGSGGLMFDALSRVGQLAKVAGLPLPPLPAAVWTRLTGVQPGNENQPNDEEGDAAAAADLAAAADSRGSGSSGSVPTRPSSTSLGSCEFVHAQAEAMPFPDASFDAVTCVYLMHELPPAARRALAAEVSRVLAPGGVLVVADSIQLGDRPKLDKNLGRFGDFNEPYYRDYIASDLVSVFGPGGAGLEPWTKELCSSTKVLSFRKPM